jgi:hypothetical protein
LLVIIAVIQVKEVQMRILLRGQVAAGALLLSLLGLPVSAEEVHVAVASNFAALMGRIPKGKRWEFLDA